MATFDITVPAYSNQGAGASNSDPFTVPGDFHGATIDDVSVVGTPTLDSDLPSDDTIGVRWNIESTGTADIWGNRVSDASSACSASLGSGAPSSDVITDGSAPSPAPTIAFAPNWNEIAWAVNYAAFMMADAETCSWAAFTIRVTYTPITPDIRQFHYRFANPITGSQHEVWPLVGSEDTSFEIVLDENYALIVKLGNDGDTTGALSLQLEYNVDGGGWNNVDGASSNVRTVGSGDLDNTSSSVERLTTSTRLFSISKLDEQDGIVIQALGNDVDYEFYWAITFRSAELTGGESIQFRVTSAFTINFDITPTATVPGNGPTFFQDVDGALSFDGDLVRETRISPDGTLAFAGDVSRFISVSRAGGLSFVGALTKRTSISVDGSLSFAGAVVRIRIILQSIAGALSFAGVLTRRTELSPSGALTFDGDIAKLTSIFQAGELTFAGALSKETQKLVAGSLDFAGALGTIVVFTQDVEGTLTFVGSITKNTFKIAEGDLTFSGDIAKQINKELIGALSFTGAINRLVNKSISGELSFVGNLIASILFSKAVAGTLSFIGGLATLFIPAGAGPPLRRMWRSVWSRVWKDPGKQDEDT